MTADAAASRPLPPGSDALLQRDRHTILADLLAARTAWAPDWLPAEGGPGRGLAEIAAGQLELLEERLKRVPDHRLAVLLDMLGASRLPAQGARTHVLLTAPPGSRGSRIPQGTRMGAAVPGRDAPVVFETQHDVAISSAAIVEVHSVLPRDDAEHDHSADVLGGRPFTLFGDARRGLARTVHRPRRAARLRRPGCRRARDRHRSAAAPHPLALTWSWWDGAQWRAFTDARGIAAGRRRRRLVRRHAGAHPLGDRAARRTRGRLGAARARRARDALDPRAARRAPGAAAWCAASHAVAGAAVGRQRAPPRARVTARGRLRCRRALARPFRVGRHGEGRRARGRPHRRLRCALLFAGRSPRKSSCARQAPGRADTAGTLRGRRAGRAHGAAGRERGRVAALRRHRPHPRDTAPGGAGFRRRPHRAAARRRRHALRDRGRAGARARQGHRRPPRGGPHEDLRALGAVARPRHRVPVRVRDRDRAPRQPRDAADRAARDCRRALRPQRGSAA